MAGVTNVQSGLGDCLYYAGYDISGDISSLDQISGGPALIDVTAIKQFANARITGLFNGDWQFTSFADVAAGASSGADIILKTLPRGDEVTIYGRGSTQGNPGAGMQMLQLNYDPTRDNTGGLTYKTEFQSERYGYDWGVQATNGLRTDTAATNGPSFDESASATTPGFPTSTTPVTNTSPLPATVVISAGTISAVFVNGIQVGTGDGTYVVGGNGGTISITYTSTAPTWTWTYQSTFGAVGYMCMTNVVGTSCTVTIQTAPDNSTWTTAVAFASVAGAAVSAQRVQNTGTMGKWVRVITTGTFSSATFVVLWCRPLSALLWS
jgi:hypothetical protein